MKDIVLARLTQAVQSLVDAEKLPAVALQRLHIERARNREHGDFATNLALSVAKDAKTNPRAVAELIVAQMPVDDVLTQVSIAGPGFINFKLAENAHTAVLAKVQTEAENYGRSQLGAGKKVLVEFVSANPTGPLHVGHGRGAAYGDALRRLLSFAGFEADAEYYVNDAGRQMHILAVSVWLRYLELCGQDVVLPANGYKGAYIWDIAESLKQTHGDSLLADTVALFEALPEDEDASIDALIERAQTALGERYDAVFDSGLTVLVDDIRTDLSEFGVEFDQWFSERSLVNLGAIESAIDVLKANDHLYQKEGAWWFRSSELGDEKDRVVLRANGAHTYFAADIAYHLQKARRGYDELINIWGADHHGYVARVKAAFGAMGQSPDALNCLLVQFAVLYRAGEKIAMSTRGGDFVTLRQLREDVGNDACRFFYVMRKSEQHMDFDLDLAKSQSADNPVYYVQYAHARICSVFNQLADKGIKLSDSPDLSLLAESHEHELMTELARFPEVVERAAGQYEPHQIAYYLRDLATKFHGYYNAHPFISSEEDVREARFALIAAVRVVLANGLQLLGVAAPKQM